MKQILGIHIGTESIGWSLVQQSTNPRIVSMGTRIFSSFVDRLGEGDREKSAATLRTQVRNARNVYFRKNNRKKKVLFFLAKHGFCPLSLNALYKWQLGESTKSQAQKMEQWFALNPYALRAKGIHEKLSSLELGRILYQLTQRRGKVMASVEDDSNAKVLYNGLPSANRLGINQTNANLDDLHLGEYLNALLPEKETSYTYQSTRVRNRYLNRTMFLEEIDALLNQQQQHHKTLNEDFILELLGENRDKGLLFFQRSASYKRSRGSLATCPFEKNKQLMWLSHPMHELYELYCWVNTIRLYGKKLTDEQREIALKIALQFSSFLFKKVRVALEVDDPYAFNYDDSTKLFLSHTLVQLTRNNAFGAKFLSFSKNEQHELWHDLHFYSDKDMLEKRLRDRWKLSAAKAKTVASIKLKPGTGKLSMKAATSILDYLKEGHPTQTAIILGGVKNAIGQQRWKNFKELKQESIEHFIQAVIIEKDIHVMDWISDFEDAFNFKLNQNKLYLLNQENEDSLPISPEENHKILRSLKPVAQKPIFELRKLINQLISEYGVIDQIKFVLSNEVKVNAKYRKSLYISKKYREQTLPKIHNAVLEAEQNPTHTNLFKYKLWLEWNKTCPYTNTPIALEDLFTDQVSVVYIQPWSRFFNDSDKNKALCMSSFKENILDKTPYEYFSEQPSGEWEQVKTRVLEQLLKGSAKNVSYHKFRHFVSSVYSVDSISREFNDQHHLAIKVKNYLSRVCGDVVATRGNAISSIRRKWGISNLEAFNQKPRYFNTREYAINALVTALNKPSFLEELRHWNRYEPLPYRGVFPTPWKRFTSDVLLAYKNISASIDLNNQVVRKIVQTNSSKDGLSPKGKLHKDSYYGKRTTPDGIESYHIKKPISSLTTAKQISKIVDYSIRELVYDQIDLEGGFINGKVPKDALTKPTETGWESKVFLPNKNGDPVPVRSVRVRENVGNAVQVSKGQNKYVNPRNNHHVMIYQAVDNSFQEHIVSFWEAVRRVREKETLYQLPSEGRMIISTLHINDCFILGLSQKEIFERLQEGTSLWEHVYKVQRISSKYYEFRHIYNLDVYDQTSPNYVRILNFGERKTGWKTHNPFKISIDVLGNITPFYKPLKVPEMQ